MQIKTILIHLFFFLSLQIVYGRNYYCDPEHGSFDNSGLSVDAPWPSLKSVIRTKSFVGGDTLFLMGGNHENLVITAKNTEDIVIIKCPGESPLINKISFSGASHWRVDSVEISSEGVRLPFNPPLEHPVYPIRDNSLVMITGGSSFITLTHCNIHSIDNASGWSKEDWNYRAWNGIYSIDNSDVTIRNCHIKNTNFAIHNNNGCTNQLYEYNVVENFNGDALRANGNNTVIQYNVVKNAYDTNGNHDDLVQAFQNDYPVVLRGNLFISHSDPNQPFKGACQGIGFFDGMYHDFIIENNVVVTNHWHGITLLGAVNCKIMNNTVVDPDNTDNMVPWIMVDDDKNGTPGSNTIIRNNITPDIRKGAGVIADHNWLISFSQYAKYFTGFDQLDLRPIKDSPAVDNGSDKDAPDVDLLGTPRPQGNGYDIGAYEYMETTGFNGVITNPSTVPKFYPNPTSSILHFDFPQLFKGRIRISDIHGKIVLEKNIFAQSGSLDLSENKSGIYLLQMESENRTFHRIVKL
jgi:parallel beta-helix repeat protein